MNVKMNKSIKTNFQYKLLRFLLFFFVWWPWKGPVFLSPYPLSIPFVVPCFLCLVHSINFIVNWLLVIITRVTIRICITFGLAWVLQQQDFSISKFPSTYSVTFAKPTTVTQSFDSIHNFFLVIFWRSTNHFDYIFAERPFIKLFYSLGDCL